jgi:hypothetical protein
MGEGDESLRFRQTARPVAGMEDRFGILGGRAQQRLLVVGIATVAGRAQWTRSPSVSISAMSTPSSEVPLINPIARIIAILTCPVPFRERPAKSAPYPVPSAS